MQIEEFLQGFARQSQLPRTLVPMTALLSQMGNPHHGLRCVHVAGTNGKGSTCAMLYSILQSAGIKTGLYTSPYLQDFCERMIVADKMIKEDEISSIIDIINIALSQLPPDLTLQLTQFDITTAMAFAHFAQKQTEIVVLETGMGGTWDATNVIEPCLCILTPIDLDHTEALGQSIDQIAVHKAGIIKQNILVISAEQPLEAAKVIREKAHQMQAPLTMLSPSQVKTHICDTSGSQFTINLADDTINNLQIRLLGAHQIQNALIAVVAARALAGQGMPITDFHIREGLYEAQWPGRLEMMQASPTIILDGAHNAHGAKALAEAMQRLFGGRKAVTVCAMLDKDISAMAKAFADFSADVIITKVDSLRAASCQQVSLAFQEHLHAKFCQIEQDLAKAISMAKEKAGDEGLVVICGSLYMVGQARKLLQKQKSAEAIRGTFY